MYCDVSVLVTEVRQTNAARKNLMSEVRVLY